MNEKEKYSYEGKKVVISYELLVIRAFLRPLQIIDIAV